MKSLTRVIPPVLLVLAISLGTQRHAVHAQSRNGSEDQAWNALTDGMSKMHLAMSDVQPSGDRDVDFVRLMVPHHQAALEMARTQLQYGRDPQMRRLAQEIVTDQQSEIELMQLWLRQHQPSAAEALTPHEEHLK